MSSRLSFLSRAGRLLRWAALAAAAPAVWACTSRTFEAPQVTPTQTFTNKVIQKINTDIDILFMVDNSLSMTAMQQKLYAQLPTFMAVLQALPMGLPSVHIAVVSSDMGAPSDVQSQTMCGRTGDMGVFQSAAKGACTDTTLNPGATYITDNASETEKNFTDPMGIGHVFQCISLLGSTGCGFEHQLASIDRALGSDGSPPPSQNAGFLRDGAYLGIVMLTNEDDCSARPDTTIYSENGGEYSITNPDGPLGNYRCNGGPRGGHVCQDPNSANPTAFNAPPLIPPSDATTGTPRELGPLTCQDNETGSSALIPVSTFVDHIKSLKHDWANQILVAAVTGPVAPYKVDWVPGGGADKTEIWPQVEHSCTSTNDDGSFADPAVRITQFVHAFGDNGVTASICENSYQNSMAAIAQSIFILIKPKCVAGAIQQDASGQPNCTVTNEVTVNGVTKDFSIASCASNGNTAPCWALSAPDAKNNCAAGTQGLTVSTDPNNPNPESLDRVIQCATCVPGVSAPGCPCTGTNDVAGCLP